MRRPRTIRKPTSAIFGFVLVLCIVAFQSALGQGLINLQPSSEQKRSLYEPCEDESHDAQNLMENEDARSLQTVPNSTGKMQITLQLLDGLTTYQDGVRTVLGTLSTTKAAAAVIAAQHCQERNDLVIKELGPDYMAGCESLDFGVTGWDTRSVQSVAVKSYLAGTTSTTDASNFIIGTPRSLTSLPVSILANVNKIPMISYWATSPDFDENSIHEQFLRTIPSDSSTATAVADLFDEYGLGHAGMLYVDDTYGDGFREALLKETNDLGISLQAFSYRENDELSIANAISGLESTDLNVIFVVAFMADIPYIMKQFDSRGMTGRGTLFVFSDAIGADELTSVIQENPSLATILNATQVVQAVSGDDRNHVFELLKENWPSFVKYKDAINSYIPGGSNFSDPTVDLHDNLSGDNLTLSVTDDLFTESALSSFIYDTAFAYDAVVSACRVTCLSYAAAGFPNITDDVSAPSFDGEDTRPSWLQGGVLVDMMKNESVFPFDGASGRVKFDSDTGSRVAETAYFKLRSLLVDPSTLIVHAQSMGDWNGSWTLDSGLLFPPGDTTTIPLQTDLPFEEKNLVGKGLRSMAYVMVGLVFLLCAGLGVWVCLNRKTRIVRKAQYEFLVIFLLGILTAVGSLAAYAYPDDHASGDPRAGAACNAFFWLVSLGTTTTATAIILKMYRIMKIFHNPSLRSLMLSASTLLKFMASVLLVNIILLLVPTILDPIQWKRFIVSRDSYDNPVESYGACSFTTSAAVRTCYWLLLAFHASLYLIGATIAYRVRDVDSSFQEGKTLAVAVIWQFQLYLIAAPIMLAVSSTETNIKFLILCLAVFLANVFAALFVMAPKVHAVVYNKEEELPRQSRRGQGGQVRRMRHKDEASPSEDVQSPLNEEESGLVMANGQALETSVHRRRPGINGGIKRSMSDSDSDSDEDDGKTEQSSFRMHARGGLFNTMDQAATRTYQQQDLSREIIGGGSRMRPVNPQTPRTAIPVVVPGSRSSASGSASSHSSSSSVGTGHSDQHVQQEQHPQNGNIHVALPVSAPDSSAAAVRFSSDEAISTEKADHSNFGETQINVV